VENLILEPFFEPFESPKTGVGPGRNHHYWKTIGDPFHWRACLIGDPQILVGDTHIFIGEPQLTHFLLQKKMEKLTDLNILKL